MTGWLHRERSAAADLRRMSGRRRGIVATLDSLGWKIDYDEGMRRWFAYPPQADDGRRAVLPGTLASERQARNLETALRLIGPYPREER